jgi:hypothetical protein
MEKWAIGMIEKILMQLPNADTYLFGYPIGVQMYKLVLLMILGESILMLTKKKVPQ